MVVTYVQVLHKHARLVIYLRAVKPETPHTQTHTHTPIN